MVPSLFRLLILIYLIYCRKQGNSPGEIPHAPFAKGGREDFTYRAIEMVEKNPELFDYA